MAIDIAIAKGFGQGFSDGHNGKGYCPPDGMVEDYYEGYKDGYDEATGQGGFDDYED